MLTYVLEDVDDEEGSDQVVDALDVATGRVSDRPDEQDPLKDLHTHTHTHTHAGFHTPNYKTHFTHTLWSTQNHSKNNLH